MDTKPLELEAEFLIRQKLIAAGFNVAKPDFDSAGADLLVIEYPQAASTKLLKVQCKGRSVSTATNIKIPLGYVTDNFVLFAYLKEHDGSSELYMFDHKQIGGWRNLGGNLCLSIPKDAVKKGYFRQYKFNDAIDCMKVRSLLQAVVVKKFAALIADLNFIERAIDVAMEIYRELHPDRSFLRPSTVSVIRSILSIYEVDAQAGSPIHCHLFTDRSDYQWDPNINQIDVGGERIAKIYWERCNGPVHVDLMSYLDRVVNAENIMLVADSTSYAGRVDQLKDEGVDIKIIQFSSNDGRRIYSKHRWGDVVYAVADAMGLSRFDW